MLSYSMFYASSADQSVVNLKYFMPFKIFVQMKQEIPVTQVSKCVINGSV